MILIAQIFRAAVLLGAIGVGACGKDIPPPVIVTSETPLPQVAPECTAPDLPWVDVPAGDVKESVAARTYRIQKQRFRDMATRRAICRTSVIAHGLAPAPAVVASK